MMHPEDLLFIYSVQILSMPRFTCVQTIRWMNFLPVVDLSVSLTLAYKSNYESTQSPRFMDKQQFSSPIR